MPHSTAFLHDQKRLLIHTAIGPEENHRMSDEESFTILGSSPTPSMEQYLSGDGNKEKSMNSRIMTTSIKGQPISNTFSLIHTDESLKPAEGTTPSLGRVDARQPKSIQSSQAESTPVASLNGTNPLAASVIMGETKSSLFHTFPSLMHSSMPIDEIQVLQHIMNEHGQMKESLQKANVAMRKNFTNIQKWQDEVKAKYADQVRTIDEQCATIGRLESENEMLKQVVATAGTRAAEQEKRTTEQYMALKTAFEEAQKQMQAERTSALAEIDELQKLVSEKESILKNMGQEIERLELEKQEFVVVKSNKPEPKAGGQFMTTEEHNRQIKVLQREMSVVVAKNLEFEDMKKVYIDELNCMRVNLTAAEEVHKKNHLQMDRQAREMETKDVTLAENLRELKSLAEQVDVLTAQLDIYKNDFEAERSARAELASDKDRILVDLKLLQKRNQQLIEEVQNGRVAEEKATRAANESLDKREPSPPKPGTSVDEAAGGTSQEEQSSNRWVLYCPLCSQAYKDLSTLQIHVEDCEGID